MPYLQGAMAASSSQQVARMQLTPADVLELMRKVESQEREIKDLKHESQTQRSQIERQQARLLDDDFLQLHRQMQRQEQQIHDLKSESEEKQRKIERAEVSLNHALATVRAQQHEINELMMPLGDPDDETSAAFAKKMKAMKAIKAMKAMKAMKSTQAKRPMKAMKAMKS